MSDETMSTNKLMKRALAVPLSGGAVIRPPRLTAPRLVSEPQLETGLDREARERDMREMGIDPK